MRDRSNAITLIRFKVLRIRFQTRINIIIIIIPITSNITFFSVIIEMEITLHDYFIIGLTFEKNYSQ